MKLKIIFKRILGYTILLNIIPVIGIFIEHISVKGYLLGWLINIGILIGLVFLLSILWIIDWCFNEKKTNRELTHHPECCCQYNPSSAIAEQTVLASECCPIHNFYPQECFANPKCKHCK